MNRRQLFRSGGMAAMAWAAGLPAADVAAAESSAAQKHSPLPLEDYEPRSMLHARETRVERPRFPVIDVHTHISGSQRDVNGVELAAAREYYATPAALLPVMDRRGLAAMVNLTGGYGAGLKDAVARYDRTHPGRFHTMTEPCYEKFLDPNYPRVQADAIAEARRNGAVGLKILKTLGLYLRSNITSGTLVRIDDPRFDPMWQTCAELNMPVAIHVSDPVAFFTPTDKYNERYEELARHPEWSFYGKDFPTNDELLAARNRVMARHPRTRFIVLHVGNYAENLENVSENLDRFPNMTVDTAARIGELGRQPRAARRFFDKYQDRILFGTDATPNDFESPQEIFGDALYKIYFRFLETDDEYFDYAPAVKPPQGRWRISGIDLPDGILQKVYNGNARRELGVA